MDLTASLKKFSGNKTNELMILYAKNGIGKSMLMSFPKFRIHDQAIVDGVTWYTISCNAEVSAWIEQQDTAFYVHLPSYRFDVHGQLYTLLALKWS